MFVAALSVGETAFIAAAVLVTHVAAIVILISIVRAIWRRSKRQAFRSAFEQMNRIKSKEGL
jgi:uncharacterized membrane-anchored protein